MRIVYQRIFYAGATAALAIFLWGWLAGNAGNLGIPGERLVAIGRLFGLIATFSILFEVFLMSRAPLIERNFDLHRMVSLHRLTGYVILSSIITHITFIVLGYAAPGHVGLWHQFLELNSQYEDVFKATLGTIILIAATALSLQVIRKRLRYELWFASHVVLYGAILLIVLHQLKTGTDFVGHFWFTAYWYMAFIGVFGVVAWYRFVMPLLNAWRHQFMVADIVPEASNIYSLYITGTGLADFRFEPGQYATLWLLAPGMWWQGHPFSFSGRPGSSRLRFTFKVSGDFTQQLPNVRKGTRVVIDGPRGSFTTDRAADADKVVLVAGGIGITPYTASIRELLGQGKPVTLLYAANSPTDIAFWDELSQLRHHGLRVELFLKSKGQRLSVETVTSLMDDRTLVYICGPDRLSSTLTRSLLSHGVAPAQIITERFAF